MKKTWSLTAKIVGAAFGTIIAALMVLLIGTIISLYSPKSRPIGRKQTAPETAAIAVSQPVTTVSAKETKRVGT